jgi:hypothetical protein
MLAGVGILLWQITNDPVLAIVFSIAADILASLPTIRKAYYDPDSEYEYPYLLSAISMVITLLTIKSWAFTTYAFPLYMLVINVVLFGFCARPLRVPETIRQIHRRISDAVPFRA